MVDLRNNFTTESDLATARALLAGFGSGTLPRTGPDGVSDSQLWAARKSLASATHPDTGEVVPLPFRMSMFMPSNLPISAGMLLSGPGRAQMFWQWLNQSYNAGFNFSNRNATVPLDVPAMTLSYVVATGTAVGMAAGLGRVVSRLGGGEVAGPGSPRPPFRVRLLAAGLPWFAVASAGAANALAMRYKEGVDGITVYDGEGVGVGTSVAAGRVSLAQVALTRVILPIPILLLPPFILDAARRSKGLGAAMASSAPVRFGVELGIIAVFLQCALPFAVALFPQTGSINAQELEPEFRGRVDGKGRPITVYTYHKGI